MYKNHVTLYSDGGCRGNGKEQNVGGIGVVLIDDAKHTKEISEGYTNTTNNAMEIQAVITGLKSLKKPCNVSLYSDSSYVINALNNHWLDSWIKNGWKTSTKQPVKNKDLWQSLIELLKMHTIIEAIHVKGHADNELNNRCDKLANEAMDKMEQELPKENKQETTIPSLVTVSAIVKELTQIQNDNFVLTEQVKRIDVLHKGNNAELLITFDNNDTMSIELHK